jgi:hypothetical protein
VSGARRELGHAQLTQPPSVDRLDVEPAAAALLANGHDVKSLARFGADSCRGAQGCGTVGAMLERAGPGETCTALMAALPAGAQGTPWLAAADVPLLQEIAP